MKKPLPLLLALILAIPFLGHAEDQPTGAEPMESEWKYFELGGFIQGALPGDFSNSTGSAKNGFGLGYGFHVGVRPLPYITVDALLDGIFHGADDASSSADEFASNAAIGLNAKVFPLGDWGPRVYALAGIAYLKYWLHDGFTLYPESGTGATYSGTRYSVGAGYEHYLQEKIVLFGEIDLSRQVLVRRVFESSPSVDLTAAATRWCPTLRAGISVLF